ncbi:hypothetical protein SAMN05216215_1012165 [Saccharopolyspora shandongensis]|uniref:Uncharacterized protein n=1 Tax=Saccharopolyspora shandongensis TaxID=418495 RepID=A0A1H3CV75_9PSEU|nr:hypothetical protein SAMN05216215_1012165 [Saccharopolyspora shandongensis]
MRSENEYVQYLHGEGYPHRHPELVVPPEEYDGLG